MHLVTRAYLKNFKEKYEIGLEESKAFEAFCNLCVFSSVSPDQVDPQDLIYDGDDPGVDGALVFFDDRLISSPEELDECLDGNRREFRVRVILTQVKSSESWQKKEIDSFVANSVDLLSESPAQPRSDFLESFRKTFLAIFENIGRVRDGRPSLEAFFVCSGASPEAVEIAAAFKVGTEAFEKTGLFNSVNFLPLDREALHELWQAVDGEMEATIATVGYAPFPDTPNVSDAYVATVSARSFLDNVLKTPEGVPRKRLFEENVRDFLGIDAEVNSEISKTLSDDAAKQRFGLMNNGVTLVATEVRPAGLNIFVRDFQIVNGCQTS